MGARILIVEDDADINEIIAVHLARQGHTCTQAYSGTEGIMRLGGGLGRADNTGADGVELPVPHQLHEPSKPTVAQLE